MAAKNRTFRTDTLTHPRTAGLHPLDRDILFFQVVAANIAGLLERSLARMARECGGGTTQKQVRASLRRLERRGIVRWWPELETVWAIEAADNQARTPNAWKAVVTEISDKSAEIRDAFWERYPERRADGYPEGPPGGPSHGPAQTGSRIKDRGSSAQKGEGHPPPKQARPMDVEAERRHQIALFREAVLMDPKCRPTPPGRRQLGTLIVGANTLEQLVRQGATADEMHRVAQELARRISSGELEPDMWNGLAFSWPYPMLRDGLPIRGKSKPGTGPASGPTLESLEDALAWSAANKGKAPPSWRWELDGRGNKELVRKGGAA